MLKKRSIEKIWLCRRHFFSNVIILLVFFVFFLVFNPKTGNIISDLQQETLGQDSSKTKTKLDIPAADIHKSVISQNNGENTLPKTVI